ncbi:MAG: hypothetical protein JRH20_13705 [Deltaproteobacteria bacterium]|nr:hypothetical protein [Deltaproteobacteria bacterium]
MRVLCKYSIPSLFVFGLLACGGPASEDGPVVSTGQQPLGSADGMGDRADTSCGIILRRAMRIHTGPGYLTSCDNPEGRCYYVWQGEIDVDPLLVTADEKVKVLYKVGAEWLAIDAKATGTTVAGFSRYSFRLDRYTVNAGSSLTSLMNTHLKLIPFLEQANGRLFDHNRVANPSASYELEASNKWEIINSGAFCPQKSGDITPIYQLDYYTSDEALHHGPVVAGESLRIRYDSRRLHREQSCMGSYGPVSATAIHMGWMVNGDPETTETALLEYYVRRNCGQSQPCVTSELHEPELQIPADAKSVQMWFYCRPGYSSGAPSNWKYDSNWGKNYQLPVEASTTQAIDWAGAWEMHASRSGFTFELPNPLVYKGFTNMGWSVQAEVYVKGVTDQPELDRNTFKAYVETDVQGCTPGTPERLEIPIADTHVGFYHNNVLVRWGYEGLLMHCDKGTYSYRFLLSADGGKTFTPLGNASSTREEGAADFRTLRYE